MSSEIAIKIVNLSKCYHIYDTPRDRLKQFVFPLIQRCIGVKPQSYFREFTALRDVSLEIKKGETVGIIGRNGSGKSTLLQMICGTLSPTSGSVTTYGRIAALLELGSGFNPEFTGRENVYMNASILGLKKDEIDARFDEIASFADIGEFIEQPVKTYSSGMMVRLAFAVAIRVDPDILIVDEALSVGDELFQRKCYSRIEAIRASGATILFVSHSGAQIVELCDRAVLLDAGEKLAIGAPKQIVGFYQKLLYAPVEMHEVIRAQIRRKKEHLETGTLAVNSSLVKTCSTFGEESEPQESFDPNLKPGSTIDYESYGPLIDVPYIISQDGRKVNTLIRGRKYRYCYRVNFQRVATGVRFGVSIKTTTGFSLAGALSAPDLKSAIGTISKGSVVDVQFSFDCNLNPGVYFMNAGVFGLLNGEEIFLHRRADIIAFRVLPISNNIETEMVSLSFEPSVSLHA